MKHITTLFLLLSTVAAGIAQTSREEIRENPLKAGSVYYAYPTTKTSPTPAPKGYKPFHISHYGRHGSRYLISNNDYEWVTNLMKRADKANALTPLGKKVLAQLKTITAEAEGRGGDLTALGRKQHRDIAERMFNDYPDVFKGNTPVDARSTLVPRCILSMETFVNQLRSMNPKLRTHTDASQKYMDTLCYHSKESLDWKKGDWKIEYDNFERAHVHPDRLMDSLFSDKKWMSKNVRPDKLMWGLYWIAVELQNMDTQEEMIDLFTADELFDLWQCINYHFYAGDGNYPGNHGLLVDNASHLVENIIATADTVINSGRPSVALRFGHDGNLIPLAAYLELDGCANQESDPYKFYTAFADFKVAPMAGNIQLIFFKNSEGDVLVKFLHNEEEKSIPVATDMFPFYPWEDVRNFYMKKLHK